MAKRAFPYPFVQTGELFCRAVFVLNDVGPLVPVSEFFLIGGQNIHFLFCKAFPKTKIKKKIPHPQDEEG